MFGIILTFVLGIGVGACSAILGILMFRARQMTTTSQESLSDSASNRADLQAYTKQVYSDPTVVPSRVNPPFFDVLCGYNPSDPNLESLAVFAKVSQNTECTFAKKSVLWGTAAWDATKSLEDNLQKSLKAMTLFFSLEMSVDGFVIEVVGREYGDTVDHFARTVCRVLTFLSHSDPSGEHCMRKSYIGGRGWVFTFNRAEAFVTSFAPCYPENHSRYAFGVEDRCYVLLQPYHSFVTHSVGRDTPETNWKCPVTPRDRIRCLYKQHNRAYVIPPTITYPITEHIVKPLHPEDEPIQFWKYGSNSNP